MENERLERSEEEMEYPEFEGHGEEQELRNKKEYLRMEVYEQYSASQEILDQFVTMFQKFVESRKRVGSESDDNLNLNLVSLSELKELVNTFKFNISQPTQNPPSSFPLKNPSEIMRVLITDELQQPKPQKTFYKNGGWDYTMKVDGIDCQKEKSFFNGDKKIKIKINSSTLKKQSFFFGLRNKITLLLEISSNYLDKEITVFRNIQDFLFLQRILQKIFPHSFISPLLISQQELKNIETQSIKAKIVQKCQSFLLSQILQRQFLLQNVFTFRFLVQQKQLNYEQHKKNNHDKQVNNLFQFKSPTGKVSIDVSEKCQSKKANLNNTSKLFERSWRNVQDLTVQIEEKLHSIDGSMFKLDQQLKLIHQSLMSQQNTNTFNFQSYSQIIDNYRRVVDLTATTIKSCENYLLQLKEEFVDKAATKWSQFNRYKDRIIAKCQDYQERRKDYLCEEAEKVLRPYNSTDLKIGMLDLQRNQAELQWIQKETFWYGHMNLELINTYEQFVSRDQQHLKNSQNTAILFLTQNIQKSRKMLFQFISKQS